MIGIADTSLHAPPPLELPPAGVWYTDPVFGARVLRVTDSSHGQRCGHAYHLWQAFNADYTTIRDAVRRALDS